MRRSLELENPFLPVCQREFDYWGPGHRGQLNSYFEKSIIYNINKIIKLPLGRSIVGGFGGFGWCS